MLALAGRFVENKAAMLKRFKMLKPASYAEILRIAIEGEYTGDRHLRCPHPYRIKVVDFGGEWNGELVFVIGTGATSPAVIWLTTVGYGSCSVNDALMQAVALRGNKKLESIYTLALHMMQRMQLIVLDDDEYQWNLAHGYLYD